METLTKPGRGKNALMPNSHLMIDIETMSTQPNGAILTIGACLFDPRGEDTEKSLRDSSAHFGPITFESNELEGRHFSPSTMAWWLQQERAAQDALFEGNLVSLRIALAAFTKWVRECRPAPTRIWAKDPDFDVVIMRNAMESLNLKWPFQFWENRSVRTTMELAYPPGGLKGEFPLIGVGVAHNALDDAIRQALMIQHSYKVLDA